MVRFGVKVKFKNMFRVRIRVGARIKVRVNAMK